jgi:hypothetical protein
MDLPVRSTGERRGSYGLFVAKLERKRLLGRPKHRWKENIKMCLQRVALVRGLD